jgi:hypothetical protein
MAQTISAAASTKTVKALPIFFSFSARYTSQVRQRILQNSNIAKIAVKFGRSFLKKLASFARLLTLRTPT